MKNYILLGIGIGMILSGIIFSVFENKDHKELEAIIRRELEEEYKKELAFTSFEKELKEMFSLNKDLDIEEVLEVKEDYKKENTKSKKEDIALDELSSLKTEENKSKFFLKKLRPLEGELNNHSIQFRSSSNIDEVLRVQNILDGTIDTKIEFIQGFYRLFAKDLYSSEYAHIIAHEIKKEFSLNPVVRSPKELDYLVLGPRRFNEKYYAESNLEIKEEVEEEVELIKKEVDELENIPLEEKKEIETILELDVKEEEIGNNFRLVFINNAKEEEVNKIKNTIKDLIDLEVEEKQEGYTVRSKKYFSEKISKDLASKLNLLFDLDVEIKK